MARTREFDPEDATQKAMALFWRDGYHASSVRDLVKATGVAHAGLYKEFGGKDGLFEASLRAYWTQLEPLFSPLHAPEAGRGEVETLFKSASQAASEGRFANGCFVANTAAELAPFGGKPALFVADVRAYQTEGFRNALSNAVARGEVKPDLPVETVSAALVSGFYGISAMLRSNAPLRQVEMAASGLLETLK